MAATRAHLARAVATVTYPWLESVRQELANRQGSGRMAHAILLSGPRGLGKVELAGQVAAGLLCLQPAEGACGVCRSCQLFASGAHPDFRLITFAINPKTDKLRTELVIEQIRDLNASMQLTNSMSPLKLALIYPAEAMNRHAANALLKTLEEPPGEAVLLLVSHDTSRLPATIRSRCQAVHVRLPDESAAVQWLADSTGADMESARTALRASAGSPLLARQMLADGEVDQFGIVIALLDRVQADEGAVAEVLEKCSLLDQEGLWNWLSLIAAQNLRASLGVNVRSQAGVSGRKPNPGVTGPVRQIALLQSLADRNRRLMATPLRKELLLRDWLIQWSRLAGS